MQILSMLWPSISFTCRHARACAGRDKPGYDVGLLVLLSNPKVLVFFGAFIPQFMDMSRDHASQVVLLGITFMAIAAVTDGLYALLAGRARSFFSAQRTRLLSRVSGGFMIGGGVWLALTRAR
jgi:threonine/homoserine/homoserine lactone efflux protein